MTIAAEKADIKVSEYKITLSAKKTDSGNRFLYHKTTNRDLYRDELARVKRNGFYDVIFFNEDGFLTEGARTNIYIQKGGRLLTPPGDCGLLNGIIRRDLIDKGKAAEHKISKAELAAADEIYISNSIIGFKKARLHLDK
jgi:para-aminobenzoate synthetase/4-amino-4-deoxychorismate lyase